MALLFILLLFRVFRKIKYFKSQTEYQRQSGDIQLPKERIVEEEKEKPDISEGEDYVKTGDSFRDKRFKKQRSPWDFNVQTREHNLTKKIEILKHENHKLTVDNSKLRRIIGFTGRKVSVSELKKLSRKQLVGNSLYVINNDDFICC